MEYFAGLDVSMDETHICVVDRDGSVVLRDEDDDFPCGNRGGAGEGTAVSANRVRDGPHGTDALPRS